MILKLILLNVLLAMFCAMPIMNPLLWFKIYEEAAVCDDGVSYLHVCSTAQNLQTLSAIKAIT